MQLDSVLPFCKIDCNEEQSADRHLMKDDHGYSPRRKTMLCISH